jgi:phosphatidylserine/phosphatidylglycerophosphate/cardiolipin synthase-like enzyme
MSNPLNFDPNLLAQLGQQTNQQRSPREMPASRPFSDKKADKSPPPSSQPAQGEDKSGASVDTFQTSVTPLIDGEQIFPKAREMIKGAKDNIALSMYEFGNMKIENKQNVAGVTDAQHFQDHEALVDELVAAQKRGVDVQVILDASKQKDGSVHNTPVADYLQQNGVEVLRYPKSKASIDHIKLLVVDDKKAMIGGMNWGVHSAVNHDANVLIEGREAAELKKEVFDTSARFSGGTPTDTKLNPDREDKIQVLNTRPVEEEGGSSIKGAIVNNIDNAKKSVHAELFSLTHKEVVQSLKDAHNRGVDVKVMLDPNLYIINRKAFYELKDAGVPVKWLTVDVHEQEKLHGKWATIDGEKSIVGSANWSHKGLDGGKPGDRTNREANVVVNDKAATNIFENTFNNDWENRGSVRVPEHMSFG